MPNMDFDIPHIQTIMKNSMLGIAGEPLGDEQQFAEFFGVKDGVLVKAGGFEFRRPSAPASRPATSL